MSHTRFDGSWLSLREQVDHRSRPVELLPPLQKAWRARGWSRVVDLGSGTASNLRYLCRRLPGPQRWTLVDQDEELLEEALQRVPDSAGAERPGPPGPALEVEAAVHDLDGSGLDTVAGAHLVTASALLDLVSAAWLARLVSRTVEEGAGALLALSYDGAIRWSGPPHPDDPLVREAVNEHQRGDKGMGPALGPTAGSTARRLFQEAGYRTWLRPSPWVLTPGDWELGHALVKGWVEAARERRPMAQTRIDAWGRHRVDGLRSGTLTVGHLDLLALP